MLDADFALYNVNQLVTLAPGIHPKAEGVLGVIARGALAAREGKIVWAGPLDEMDEAVRIVPDATVLNTHGGTALPGFVDPHTHPVFAGNRAGDFYARALGATYQEQLGSGGIMQTIRSTRARDEDGLLYLAYRRADTFLQYGTTTIQGKTGYGLTEVEELKALRVLNRLQHLHPLKVIPAFLPAHVVPADWPGTPESYVDAIVEDWLPAARDHTEFVDVWCDEGAFTLEQCRRILTRAREMGFMLTAHVNELGPAGGAAMAAALGARSVDHAVYLDETEITALRDSGTVAVLLPGTTFFLGSDRYAPARALIDAGVTVALGTDFNPGTSYTQNMQFVLTLAVLKLRMTPEEALRAATLHAARAIGMDDRVGSLEPGKYCDLTVFAAEDYRQIPYSYGMNLADSVVATGRVVVREKQLLTAVQAVPHPV